MLNNSKCKKAKKLATGSSFGRVICREPRWFESESLITSRNPYLHWAFLQVHVHSHNSIPALLSLKEQPLQSNIPAEDPRKLQHPQDNSLPNPASYISIAHEASGKEQDVHKVSARPQSPAPYILPSFFRHTALRSTQRCESCPSVFQLSYPIPRRIQEKDHKLTAPVGSCSTEQKTSSASLERKS